eukprot:TRINITY_DN7757_c0_g1_i3.p1 TRINITY_DN7757_c0_g1~~TRINITY_DN7757_c0_g1_i3.p1  ORF type:complete len:275 (+),score=61.78 TRINITY_DN7757_c0_g1_i3:97-825(+)
MDLLRTILHHLSPVDTLLHQYILDPLHIGYPALLMASPVLVMVLVIFLALVHGLVEIIIDTIKGENRYHNKDKTENEKLRIRSPDDQESIPEESTSSSSSSSSASAAAKRERKRKQRRNKAGNITKADKQTLTELKQFLDSQQQHMTDIQSHPSNNSNDPKLQPSLTMDRLLVSDFWSDVLDNSGFVILDLEERQHLHLSSLKKHWMNAVVQHGNSNGNGKSGLEGMHVESDSTVYWRFVES